MLSDDAKIYHYSFMQKDMKTHSCTEIEYMALPICEYFSYVTQ